MKDEQFVTFWTGCTKFIVYGCNGDIDGKLALTTATLGKDDGTELGEYVRVGEDDGVWVGVTLGKTLGMMFGVEVGVLDG